MHCFKFILISVLSLSFLACTLFKKQISKPIVVALPDTNFKVFLHSSASNTKYINLITQEEIKSGFLSSFESEGRTTQNIIYSNIAQNVDFILKINYLSVSESSSTEKISDPTSPYNGQSYELNSVDCSVEVDVINAKTNAIIGTCYNSKTRSEKVTNNRDLGDLITGSNKDHSSYHEKLLSDNICLNLTEDVGRRIWTPITRKLEKALK